MLDAGVATVDVDPTPCPNSLAALFDGVIGKIGGALDFRICVFAPVIGNGADDENCGMCAFALDISHGLLVMKGSRITYLRAKWHDTICLCLRNRHSVYV